MKVPGGKLLRVILKYEGERIVSVKFAGDFFAYPEEAIESLEEKLAGVSVKQVRGIVESELEGVRLYGVDAKSIVKGVWEAFG